MRFKDLKIGTKLISGFLTVVALIVAVGGFSIYKMSDIAHIVRELNENWLPSIDNLTQMQRSLLEMRVREYKHLAESDPSKMPAIEGEIKEILENYRAAEKDYVKLIANDEERKIYDQLANEIKEYLPMHEHLISLSRAHRQEEGNVFILGDMAGKFVDIKATIKKLVDIKKGGAEKDATSGIAAYESSRTMIISAIIIAIITAISIALYLTRLIVTPINMAAEMARTLQELDLTKRMEIDSRDEVGRMAEALNSTADSISEIMKEIQSAAEHTAASGEELAASAQNISSGAQEQASTVEEVSAAVQSMTTSIQGVSEAAGSASGIAEETRNLAREGSGTVKKSIEGMELINESSKRITKIIGVISQIANQTNLLALNAAIEAASAGEHGLGFAVVADEVRKLAERSSQAADEITQLIEESNTRAAEGAKLSEAVGESLEKINSGIEKTAAGMERISTDTRSQSTIAQEVSKSVEGISAVTEENSSSAEEMAASAEELSAQAQRLQDLVARFSLDDGVAGKKNAPVKAQLTQSSKLVEKAPIRGKLTGADKPKPKGLVSSIKRSEKDGDGHLVHAHAHEGESVLYHE